MRRLSLIGTLSLALSLVLFGCDSDDGVDSGTTMDSGLPPGVDGGPRPDSGPGGGTDTGPGSCETQIEICGDRIDQNCDGRDQSCGDNDSDLWQACRVEDNLMGCDCDDTRSDVYPSGGEGVPGAPELCDGVDNDCNGLVDDAPECCAGCSGIDPTRADTCTAAGACECSTDTAAGPCGEGRTCCSSGCVDTTSDPRHCGTCGSCGGQADTCTAGVCSCGGGEICMFTDCCVGGSCVARVGATCPGD